MMRHKVRMLEVGGFPIKNINIIFVGNILSDRMRIKEVTVIHFNLFIKPAKNHNLHLIALGFLIAVDYSMKIHTVSLILDLKIGTAHCKLY